MPKISIVIPTCNRPRLLARALKSVQAQTFQDFEVLVIQNGGKEDAKPVVAEFSKNIPVFYFFDPKPCAVSARNYGIQVAKGDYIAFLDDDDEWLPTKLEHQFSLLSKSTDIGLVSCRGIRINNSLSQEDFIPKYFQEEISLHSLIEDGCPIYALSSILIRKKCFDELGVFNTNYLIANDYEFYLRLARKYKIKFLSEPLCKYYKHGNNLSDNYSQTLSEVIKTLRSFSRGIGTKDVTSWVKKGIKKYGKEYYFLASEALTSKSYREAFKLYWQAIKYDPYVGIHISWSRFNNPFYSFFRPYLALIYCSLLGVK